MNDQTTDPMDAPMDAPTGTPDPQVFVDYLGRTRWFGGKGRPFAVTGVRRVGLVPGSVPGGPVVLLCLAEVTYDDVGDDAADKVEHYQVPLALYPEPQERLEHALVAAEAPRAPEGIAFTDGALDGEAWMSAVADAVSRIERGDLEKVRLARDQVARADGDVDVRWPLRQLSSAYPMCWTFHVDGMVGATPEMLVRRERGLVTSRVLAGTIRRTGDDERDLALAAALARSSKDLEEHEYAVRSVADALDPHCSSMNVPEAPFVLHLPNVMHLATDVAGVARDARTSLELAAALHPSAAVGGTPTTAAVALIAEIEQMDRGRYAGPVGWMDASGDGEGGIALRSASVSGDTVRLFAGCGIVADSDPEAELAEAQAKFVPVRDSLST